AYIVDGNLIAGPIGGQRQIVGSVVQPMMVPAYPPTGRRPVYARPMVAFPESSLKLGAPSWSPDNHFVYCADCGGHLVRYDLQSSRPDGLAESQVLPFDGESPAPLPTEAEKLVFVRAQPRPKLGVPGKQPSLDITEVVVGDLSTKAI